MIRHKHKWELISKEFVKGQGSALEFDRASYAAARMMLQAVTGYYSYVFQCPCGEVKVERS